MPASSNDRSVRSSRTSSSICARSLAPPNRSPFPAAGTIAAAAMTLLLLQGVGDPALDFFAQHPQRQRSILENHVVEVADVEFGAKLLRGFFAQPPNLEVADHVGRGLTRRGDVAIDFRRGAVLVLRGVRAQVVNALLPRPAEHVHAGVNDQA